jgi:hypothetical protein
LQAATENLKVQVSVLRKALGGDRDVIRTEIRPPLPIHRRAALECRGTRLSIAHATKAAVWPNSVSTELSANAPV